MNITPPNIFSRTRSDDVPLEQSPPVESWGKGLLGAIIIIAALAVVYVFLPALVGQDIWMGR